MHKTKNRTPGNVNSTIFCILTTTLLLVLNSLANVYANEAAKHHVIELEPLTDWQERDFVDSTDYSIKTIQDEKVIAASSNASASMLYKKVKIDLTKTPYLNWKWQIDKTIMSNADEKSREGDDFSARIYVAFKPSRFSIKPKALTYVWASKEKQLSHWDNPYSKSVVMLAIQSGNEKSKQWVSEKRNLKKDLERLFKQPIGSIEGIAIMSDTDNTKTSASAIYNQLFFSAK